MGDGIPVDPDFADFVAARQETLLRSAFLVCGDAALAVRVVEDALVGLARQWQRVRDDQPDAVVRRLVHRAALATWKGRPAPGERPAGEESAAPADPDPDETDAERVRREVLAALDGLTPRQRSVVVLLHLEGRGEGEAADVLGTREGTVRAEESAALGRLRAALPALGDPRLDLRRVW